MTIKKLRKRKDENKISSVGKKDESFFSLFLPPPSLPLSVSFYMIGNHNPHIPISQFVS
jgi:hypothetical protein